jgi:hypothetical protein
MPRTDPPVGLVSSADERQMAPTRPLILVTLAIAIALAEAPFGEATGRSRQPLALRAAASYHALPSAFAGFNSPFRKNSRLALAPELRRAAAGLRPGALRVFGGTTANYWNWRTGRFYDRPGVPRLLRLASRVMPPVHLADWARLVDGANATPVFDLNLVTSRLRYQLAMLKRASELGMPIRWVELGNELYIHAPLVDRAIPGPEAYGRMATRWIGAIKKHFPRAQVAVVGYGGPRSRSAERRRQNWDRGMLRTLRGADALTFHTYWKAPPGALSDAKLSKVLAAPLRRLSVLRFSALRKLPAGMDGWVTEWNLWHGSQLRGAWVDGLASAEYLLGLLAQPQVHLEDHHALILRKPFSALFHSAHAFGGQTMTVPFGPTATGLALGHLHRLLSDAPRVRPLIVHPAPRIPGTEFAAVRAVQVDGRGVLLVNVTDARLRLELGDAGCDGFLDSIWAQPGTRITGHAGEVNRRVVESEGSLTLPRYSISRLSC